MRGLSAARAGAGTQAPVAGLASPKVSNEDLYLFGKLFRGYLGSNNIATFDGSYGPTAQIGGAAIADIETADVIVLLGADPIANQPVIDLRFKKAYRLHQTKFLIVGEGPTGLDHLAAAKVEVFPARLRAAVEDLTRARLAGETAPVAPVSRPPTDLIGINLEAPRLVVSMTIWPSWPDCWPRQNVH